MYNVVENPIPTSNLWATPAKLEDLYAQLSLYTGEEKALAMHVMMLTLNTCNKLVEDKILSKEVFAC